jgi:hypothetical protein
MSATPTSAQVAEELADLCGTAPLTEAAEQVGPLFELATRASALCAGDVDRLLDVVSVHERLSWEIASRPWQGK